MYIVTGATGHIGNNFIRFLIERNIAVKALIRKTDISLSDLALEISIGDIFDSTFLDQEVSSDDVLIHTAGYIDLYNQDLIQSFRTNYQGTKKIVDFCMKKNVRLIYISSVDVLVKTKNILTEEPLDLIQLKRKKSYYQASKTAATNYVIKQMKRGLNATILYPSAVIGPNDFKPSKVGLELLNILKHKILFSMTGGYNFIDVRDVAQGIYESIRLKENHQIILSGHQISIRSLYLACMKATQTQKIIIPLPTFLVRIAALIMPNYSQIMISKLKENSNYNQRKMKTLLLSKNIDFNQTIQDTLDFLKRNKKEQI